MLFRNSHSLIFSIYGLFLLPYLTNEEILRKKDISEDKDDTRHSP